MKIKRINHIAALLPTVALLAGLFGCQGMFSRTDPQVRDVQLPSDDVALGFSGSSPEPASFPDLVEQMLATRETLLSVRGQYFEELAELERSYLLDGDTVKANWARRQRERLEQVDVTAYPYLTAAPPEHRVEVAPEHLIAEADEIYTQALALLNEVRGIPAIGFLEHNKRKAREALGLFQLVLAEYPTSDKVDDCAFYCGEIYKEYLRDDDPDNELAIRYYTWAFTLDPQTPHAARFQCAVAYDFRRHDRARALELYHEVLQSEEDSNLSNMRFAATRIEQLTDDEFSHLRPQPSALTAGPASDATDEDPAP
jgi:tetratricopeptide (TPR) repeat protein